MSLHEYVYKSDFAGFREKMKYLDHKENHPVLIVALQSVDDKVQLPALLPVTPTLLMQPVTDPNRMLYAGYDHCTPLGMCWEDR